MGLRIPLSQEQLSELHSLAEKTVGQGDKYGYFQPDGLSHNDRIDRFQVAYAGELAVANLYGVKPVICSRDFSKPVKHNRFQADVFYKDTAIQVKTTREYGKDSFKLNSPTLTYICYYRQLERDIQIVTISYETQIQKIPSGYVIEIPKDKWQKIQP